MQVRESIRSNEADKAVEFIDPRDLIEEGESGQVPIQQINDDDEEADEDEFNDIVGDQLMFG